MQNNKMSWTSIRETRVRTSALPRQQQSDWGLRVIQNAYLSLITHTKQLLLVILIGASCWTHRRTDRRTDGQTDRRTDGCMTEGQTDVKVEIVI